MNYGMVFGQAGRLSWRHKSLWLWAGLGSAGTFLPWLLPLPTFDPASWSQWSAQFARPIPLLVGSLVTVAVVGLLWLLNLLAEAALIAAVHQIQTGGSARLWQLWQTVRHFFLSLVAVDALVWLPALFLSLLLLFGLLLLLGFLWTNINQLSQIWSTIAIFLLCLSPLVILLLPILWLSGIVRTIAFRFVVGQGVGAKESVRRVGQLCRHHFGQLLIATLLIEGLRQLISTLLPLLKLPLWFMGGKETWLVVVGQLLFFVLGAGLYLYCAHLWTLCLLPFTHKMDVQDV